MPTATLTTADSTRYRYLVDSATHSKLTVQTIDETTLTVSSANDLDLVTWLDKYKYNEWLTISLNTPFKTKVEMNPSVTSLDLAQPLVGRSWFKATEIASIYNFPAPDATPKVIGVVSFGGGLVGTVSASGVLTDGDVQAYWSYLGIPSSSWPTVVIVPLAGATNAPNPSDGATIENTIDVEMIGGCYPSSNLTIILYIVPNTLANFTTVFNYALTTPVTVNGVGVKPSVISVSWGAPEIYFSNIAAIDAVFQRAVAQGVNICCASGDNGSKDGVAGNQNYCDFPSSSPNVVACGGTRLVCPNYVYDGSTIETAWTSGGGAVSRAFSKPAYQSAITASGRSTPDISLVADPNTGVVYIIGGLYYVYGGTSIVSPAFSAYLLATNTTRFINTRLYTASAINFHDIVSGNNGGYTTRAGYDNCTGWGSIKGTPLAAVLNAALSVTGVTLNTSAVTIHPTQTYQLVPTIAPSGATNQSVSWSSNNVGVARVTNGLVTGVSTGSAVITVTTADGNRTATALITVTIGATSVSLNTSSLALTPNQTSQLTATVLPTDAANKTLIWTSSNVSVASVTSGLVRALANGTSVITVTTVDGSFTATATITVTTPVTGVTVNKSTMTLSRSRTRTGQITATVNPTTASNKAVTWSSNHTNIATVSSTGLVTAVAVGTATITVTTVNGSKVANTAVTVTS